MSLDITSANSIAVLSCELFSEKLQQFAVDTAYEGEDVQIAETRIGVDGKMVAGYTPQIKPLTIHLEASSPSIERMVLLEQSMQKNRKVYPCQMVITQPSIGKRITYSNGVLQSAKSLADGKTVLDPVQYTFHFEDRSVETM